jgi:rhamnosyltransferase
VSSTPHVPSAPATLAAVVVTFHPAPDLAANLQALREQIDTIILVDNGSHPAELEPVRSAASSLGLTLIENGENLGIASALNIGIRHALVLHADYIFLFDQDSTVTPGFVTSMLQAFHVSPWGERLALLVPRYLDPRTHIELEPWTLPEGGLQTTMTSGTLLPAEVVRRHGFFRDELFIDSVDDEYSLRLRRAGRVLDFAPGVTLLHSLGDPALARVAGRSFRTANYSPIRRYYQERNRIWMLRHYGRDFPTYFRRVHVVSLKEFIKIALAERHRSRKLFYFLRGVFDGLRNRMGRLNP